MLAGQQLGMATGQIPQQPPMQQPAPQPMPQQPVQQPNQMEAIKQKMRNQQMPTADINTRFQQQPFLNVAQPSRNQLSLLGMQPEQGDRARLLEMLGMSPNMQQINPVEEIEQPQGLARGKRAYQRPSNNVTDRLRFSNLRNRLRR
jgi:hypothetical protein